MEETLLEESTALTREPFSSEILNSSTWADMDTSRKDAYISYSAASSAL